MYFQLGNDMCVCARVRAQSLDIKERGKQRQLFLHPWIHLKTQMYPSPKNKRTKRKKFHNSLNARLERTCMQTQMLALVMPLNIPKVYVDFVVCTAVCLILLSNMSTTNTFGCKVPLNTMQRSFLHITLNIIPYHVKHIPSPNICSCFELPLGMNGCKNICNKHLSQWLKIKDQQHGGMDPEGGAFNP